jgi:hypothetical protein
MSFIQPGWMAKVQLPDQELALYPDLWGRHEADGSVKLTTHEYLSLSADYLTL